MGWRRVAEQEWGPASPESKKVLQAYADGVNAYIADRSPDPARPGVPDASPDRRSGPIEPWTPVDSLAWGKAIAWDLRSNADDEVNRVKYAAAVGGPRSLQLYPDYPFAEHPEIVDQGTVVDGVFDYEAPAPAGGPGTACTGTPLPGPCSGGPDRGGRGGAARESVRGRPPDLGMTPLARATAEALDAVDPALTGLSRIEADLAALIGPVGDGIGSNSWAVAPDAVEHRRRPAGQRPAPRTRDALGLVPGRACTAALSRTPARTTSPG